MRSTSRCHTGMFAMFAATMAVSEPVAWAEPAQCLSMDPADWPPAARPYFLLMVSTAGSMSANVGGNVPASCTGGNNTSYGIDRRAHTRCALKNVVEEYGADVNFGLATHARTISGCSDDGNGLCNYGSCTHANFTGSADANCGMGGCGPEPNPAAVNSSSRAGAYIRVGVPSQPNNAPNNVPAVVAWLDGSCADSRELFASGCRPTNGMLRDAFRYYSNQWVPPAPVPGGQPLASPLTSVANGERQCRRVHTILITDGDEACDVTADAVDAAGDLYVGFVKDGIQWSVRTHVINFAGNQASADSIAAAGGTGSALFVANEAQLTSALQGILDAAVVSETCDNVDNNCNGCTDEGFVHYCHQAQACCAWATQAQRTVCLVAYQASLPDGDPKLLPCTTPVEQADPTRWLCFDPGDVCDDIDNNCAIAVDEGCAGSSCADASACTSGFCVDEVCCDAACGDGAVDDCVACSVAAGAAVDGTCAPLTGPACDDGDACTLADACQAGVCTSDAPVMCPPPDDCHEAAVCAPNTGECEFIAKADDSPCEDGDPCTQDDVCAAGTCVAGAPAECVALDDCHDAGVCDPQSGACSDPVKPDGSPCGDGGACANGSCMGMATSGPDSSSGATGETGETGGTGETGVTGVPGTGSDGGLSSAVTEGGQLPTEQGGDPGATSGTGSDGTGTDTTQDGGGCGCNDAAPPAPRGMLVALLLGAVWRRSRRGA